MSELLRKFFSAVLTDLGSSSGVKRSLAAAAKPSGFHVAPQSIGQESVIRWHWWNLKRQAMWHFDVASEAMLKGPDILVSQLAERYEDPRWKCDIREVQGFFASKSDLSDLRSIDEMVAKSCPSYVSDVSAKGLEKNLAHHEIRIIHGGSDHFERYGWDGRVFLANDGGSHHFAAAQYLAKQLGASVPLSGKLINYRLNPQVATQISRDYEVFVMDLNDIYGDFHDEMRLYKAPFAVIPMPPPCTEDCAAIFLPKDVKRSLQVAELLREGGFYNLGEHLKALARAPANVPLIPVPKHAAPAAVKASYEADGHDAVEIDTPRI